MYTMYTQRHTPKIAFRIIIGMGWTTNKKKTRKKLNKTETFIFARHDNWATPATEQLQHIHYYV